MLLRLVTLLMTLGLMTPAFAEETLKATVVEQPKADAKTEEAKPAEAAKPAQTAANAGAGFANTECTNGKNTRNVELTSTNAQTKLPCEVHYKKTTEQAGHDQVLWQSANNLSYCESKAQAFVEKLKGWGWTCTAK